MTVKTDELVALSRNYKKKTNKILKYYKIRKSDMYFRIRR